MPEAARRGSASSRTRSTRCAPRRRWSASRARTARRRSRISWRRRSVNRSGRAPTSARSVTACRRSSRAHGLTTPDTLTLHRELAELGTARVAMEVSSHALAQDRIAGLAFHTAVFTNLTRDHLDLHGDFDELRQCEAPAVSAAGAAVRGRERRRSVRRVARLRSAAGLRAACARARAVRAQSSSVACGAPISPASTSKSTASSAPGGCSRS